MSKVTKYQAGDAETIEGRRVVIHTVDGPNEDFPIVASTQVDGGLFLPGSYSQHGMELQGVKPNASPRTETVSLWVYWSGTGHVTTTQQFSPRQSDIARRRIEVTLTEGEFDE